MNNTFGIPGKDVWLYHKLMTVLPMWYCRIFLCLFTGGTVQELPQGLIDESSSSVSHVQYSDKRSVYISTNLHITDWCYSLGLMWNLGNFILNSNLKVLSINYSIIIIDSSLEVGLKNVVVFVFYWQCFRILIWISFNLHSVQICLSHIFEVQC